MFSFQHPSLLLLFWRGNKQAISVTHPFLQPPSFRIFITCESFQYPFLPLVPTFTSFSMKLGGCWAALCSTRAPKRSGCHLGYFVRCWDGGTAQTKELLLCKFSRPVLQQFALGMNLKKLLCYCESDFFFSYWSLDSVGNHDWDQCPHLPRKSCNWKAPERVFKPHLTNPRRISTFLFSANTRKPHVLHAEGYIYMGVAGLRL